MLPTDGRPVPERVVRPVRRAPDVALADAGRPRSGPALRRARPGVDFADLAEAEGPGRGQAGAGASDPATARVGSPSPNHAVFVGSVSVSQVDRFALRLDALCCVVTFLCRLCAAHVAGPACSPSTSAGFLSSSAGPAGGNRLRLALSLAGVSQSAVARETGFTQPYVSDVVRSR